MDLKLKPTKKFLNLLFLAMATIGSRDLETKKRYNLTPTAEVTLTNLVREQNRAEEELPLRFTALTPCFRSEAARPGAIRAACCASTSS